MSTGQPDPVGGDDAKADTGTTATPSCAAGYTDCDGKAENGCETATASDRNHCGACNKACTQTELCVSGVCGTQCLLPLTICGGDCINTQSDPNRCGSCSNVCAGPPSGHGYAGCDTGACTVVCDAGYHLVGGDCIPDVVCGDSQRDTSESCDDGNTASSDGCSSNCQVESGYTCVGAGPGSCTRPLQAWSQQAFVKASNTGSFDNFGSALALSADGATMIIGAPNEASCHEGVNANQSDDSCEGAGAVYVFVRNAGTWVQQAYLKPAQQAGRIAAFGASVATSADGNTIAVGAPLERSASRGVNQPVLPSGADFGAVFVFARTSAGWTQQAYVKSDNGDFGDKFGSAVALSADGNSLAVGAPGEAGRPNMPAANDRSSSGAVYTFSRSSGTWSQQQYLKAGNADAQDAFGTSVALSADGSSLVVGAIGESSSSTGINGDATNNAASQSGAVYAFARTGSVWSQQAYVKPSNTSAYHLFGNALSIAADGSTFVVGASRESSRSRGVASQPYNTSGTLVGAAYVFARTASTWRQEVYIKASNADDRDFFGAVVALCADGNSLAVSAPGEASSASGINGAESNNSMSNSGAVYTFARSGSSWRQTTYIKASNNSLGIEFGGGCAIAADARTLALGAGCESSSSTGVNGSQSGKGMLCAGAAYVFAR